MSGKNSNANKKRGASAMLSSDYPSVDTEMNTVLDTVKVVEVRVDDDTEDNDNVVGEQMMATLYSPAVDKGVGERTKRNSSLF